MSVRSQRSFLESCIHQIFSVQIHTHALKKVSPSTIATTRQATKSTTMVMAQRDTTTMTTSTDVEVDNDSTASSEVAARREAEVVRIFATRQPAGEIEEGGSRMDT
jgi:hypothetical protein